MSTHAKRERLLLADLLESGGPDAPTLCGAWTTRDLVAHLVVRERRPDAAGGILLSPLAARLERVQAEYAARPYGELLQMFREGPGQWSPFRLKQVDEGSNLVEFFVHAEDIRRAADSGWEPRALDPALEGALWRRLELTGRVMCRRSPVGLVLRRPNGQTVVARKGAPVVTATADPGELVLFAYGRQRVARVGLDGEEAAVTAAREARLGLA